MAGLISGSRRSILKANFGREGHLFEPDEENFQVLRNNTQGLSDVTLLKGGLWHTKTQLSISDKYEIGKWGMVVEESERGGTNETLIETLYH